MGRLRSALRAYAIDAADPGEVLDKLNRKFIHFEPGQMATVLYLTISPDHETMTLASAGHPPPVAGDPGRRAEFLACTPRPPIGVLVDERPWWSRMPARRRRRRWRASPTACSSGGPSRSTSSSNGSGWRVTAAAAETVCSDVMGTMVGSTSSTTTPRCSSSVASPERLRPASRESAAPMRSRSHRNTIIRP